MKPSALAEGNVNELNPYVQGFYAAQPEEVTKTDLEVIGELPTDLWGAYVRNGPNPFEVPDVPHHWFDGEGMVHSIYFENGKAEGSFANYMEHHLGPELDAITSFTFTDPTLSVTRNGHMAYGYETYGYRIELEDGRVIERDGVATSVLSHDESGWKIVQYHSSSRAPRRP